MRRTCQPLSQISQANPDSVRNSPFALLHRIYQRSQTLNPHFQSVSAMDRADAAGRAGQNHVAGQKREVGGNETHEFGGLEDELPRVRVLAQQSVLKKLD